MAGSAAWADIASGKFNSGNGRWSIDDEGTLYVNVNSISSDFSMPDYGEGKHLGIRIAMKSRPSVLARP